MNAQETLFNQILDILDSVNLKEWDFYLKDGAIASMLPYNPISKRAYKGTNKTSLWLFNFFNIYSSNYYATFKQISQAGGKLKKGSKAVDVLFYNLFYRHQETKKRITSKEFLKLKEDEKETYKKEFIARVFKVFNFDNIENINDMNFDLVDLEDEVNKIEEIENFVSGTGAEITHGITSSAYYSPKKDFIKLPKTKYFKSESAYYATLLHELIHWSGHENRMNRAGIIADKKEEAIYAKEELIAECGSLILYTEYNLFSELENSCRYLKAWLERVEGNRDTLQHAFKQANRAVGYLKKISLEGNKLKTAS